MVDAIDVLEVVAAIVALDVIAAIVLDVVIVRSADHAVYGLLMPGALSG